MSDLPSLLPPISGELERAIEQVAARATGLHVPLRDLLNPGTCPEALLPFLAWFFSVDEWQPAWDVPTKRGVIAASLSVHLTKGTPGSLRLLLDAVGFPGAVVTEWFDTPSPGIAPFHMTTPHTFSIGFDPQGSPVVFDEAVYDRLFQLLAHTAPVRSHICVYIDGRTAATLGLAATAQPVITHQATYCLEAPPAETLTEPTITGITTPVLVVCLFAEL